MTRGRPGLRGRLTSGALLAAPGAYDALTARIVERCGFQAVYLGGNALGASLAKGQPFVTLSETAEACLRISRAVECPLIVDAGAGFGGPAHAHLAVRELEAAGAAALHIDDQPYPKEPAYHRGEGRLAPVEEVTAKLSAAVRARRDPDTLVIARTDALRVTGALGETVSRCRAYSAAGVDALLVLDLSPAEAPALRQAIPDLPLAWIGGVTAPTPTLSDLAAGGFALALYPFNTLAAVNAAVADLWGALRISGEISQSAELLARGRRETLEIVRMQEAFDLDSPRPAQNSGEASDATTRR
ncbi:MAG: isocitrate lyase/PEP mutase family protein [Phenylobacterium sp.]